MPCQRCHTAGSRCSPGTVIPDCKQPFLWRPHTRHHRKPEALYRGGNHTPEPPRRGGVASHVLAAPSEEEEEEECRLLALLAGAGVCPLCRAASLSPKASRTRVRESSPCQRALCLRLPPAGSGSAHPPSRAGLSQGPGSAAVIATAAAKNYSKAIS